MFYHKWLVIPKRWKKDDRIKVEKPHGWLCTFSIILVIHSVLSWISSRSPRESRVWNRFHARLPFVRFELSIRLKFYKLEQWFSWAWKLAVIKTLNYCLILFKDTAVLFSILSRFKVHSIVCFNDQSWG